MSHMIACPSCHNPIEVTEILRAQITAQVRSEFEAGIRRQQDEIAQAKSRLERNAPISVLRRQVFKSKSTSCLLPNVSSF